LSTALWWVVSGSGNFLSRELNAEADMQTRLATNTAVPNKVPVAFMKLNATLVEQCPGLAAPVSHPISIQDPGTLVNSTEYSTKDGLCTLRLTKVVECPCGGKFKIGVIQTEMSYDIPRNPVLVTSWHQYIPVLSRSQYGYPGFWVKDSSDVECMPIESSTTTSTSASTTTTNYPTSTQLEMSTTSTESGATPVEFINVNATMAEHCPGLAVPIFYPTSTQDPGNQINSTEYSTEDGRCTLRLTSMCYWAVECLCGGKFKPFVIFSNISCDVQVVPRDPVLVTSWYQYMAEDSHEVTCVRA
jgi:hypothetical protein